MPENLDGGYNKGCTTVMKTAISIPDDFFGAAERTAKRLGLSRSRFYQRALTAFLENHNEQAVTRTLDEVYASEPDHSGLDPVLEALQRASERPEPW